MEFMNEIMQDASHSSRPHLTNRHSNSVPPSPSPQNRRLSFGATRARSPEKRLRDGSPKSISTTSQNGTRMRAKAPSVTGCQYETGMAQAKRRIPYAIGDDQLERPKAMPKKFLNPAEEAKLSGDMRDLYDRLLPTKESDRRRQDFVRKLHRILNDRWPGNNIQVHVFGSSGNKLCTNDSDVDICIKTPLKEVEKICTLASVLAEHEMKRVVCIPNAKVPIVKFWDPQLQLACDMNVNNPTALENTRMIKTYVEIDERVRPLAMIIKHWAKQRVLNDAALGGTLSSYAWICMILNFLQTRNPPILPSLHEGVDKDATICDGKYPAFRDDIESLRGFGKKNRETLGDLLFHFFRKYAYDFDYEKNVISVKEGRLLSKASKVWLNGGQNTRLCVEEPFTTSRNLGNTADDFSFKGIHLELRRAFDRVAEAKLHICMEQYSFPPQEERFFEKPAPKPPPVLTRSRSQSQSSRGKSGYGNRGGRNHSSSHHSRSRRASSAASSNKFPLPYNGVPIYTDRPGASQEDAVHAQFEQLKLHRRLFEEMQALQRREYELRLQQAQNLLQAELEVHASIQGHPNPPHSAREQSRRLQAASHGPLTAPLRGGPQFSPHMYPQVPGTPQPNIHTQPSSPSFRHAQPDLRRSIHRSSFGEGSASGILRSQSQPARPMQVNGVMQNLPPLPMNSQQILRYQHARQQQQLQSHPDQLHHALENQAAFGHHEPPSYIDAWRQPIQQISEENVPKEYAGYWINDSPPSQVHRDEFRISRMPQAHELYPRVRGVPPSFGRIRDVSRSPSPSPNLPFRDRASSIQSSASGPLGRQRFERVHGTAPPPRGPTIVNGTDSNHMHESTPMVASLSHATAMSEATSGSEDPPYETIVAAEMEPYINGTFEEGFAVDQAQQIYSGQSASDRSRPSPLDPRFYLEASNRRLVNQPAQAAIPQGPSKHLHRDQGPGRGLNIQFGEVEYTRPSPKQEQANPQVNGCSSKQTSRVDPPSAPSTKGPGEKDALPLPLLSPVREVRTPSPAGKRNIQLDQIIRSGNLRPVIGPLDPIPSFADLKAKKERANLAETQLGVITGPPNGILLPKVNGTLYAETTPNASPSRLPQAPQNTPSSMSPRPSGPHTVVNGWQQQISKKNKNRSRPGSEQIFGEPLPVHESERKGG